MCHNVKLPNSDFIFDRQNIIIDFDAYFNQLRYVWNIAEIINPVPVSDTYWSLQMYK